MKFALVEFKDLFQEIMDGVFSLGDGPGA